MQYKAIIFDVDNTLVPNASLEKPSENIRKVVKKAQRKGIHVGVATARPLKKVAHIFEYLNLKGPSILSDGAQIIDAEKSTYFKEWPMNKDDVLLLGDFLKKKPFRFWIQDSGEDHLFSEGYRPQKPFVIVVHGLKNRDEADSFIHLLPKLPNSSAHLSTSGNTKEVDIFIKRSGATKAHALTDLAKILSIETDEIIGVGDGYNDFFLLMASGLKVAMGNAVEDLKGVADYVAPDLKDKGLVEVFNKFLLEN